MKQPVTVDVVISISIRSAISLSQSICMGLFLWRKKIPECDIYVVLWHLFMKLCGIIL